MIQLEPGEQFPITRQLDNPADTNTYYIRAYIRNAKTDELLDTVKLTDKGSQRFRGNWYVPQDASGQGIYITITTLIFTDSDYTTESEDYARAEFTYLIQQRWNSVFGGGGGADFSYKKIRAIIQEEIFKIKFPEVKHITKYNTVREKIEIDLRPVIKKIEDEIQGIKIPGQKEVDFGPLIKILEEIKNQVNKIKMPETDLSPLLNNFAKLFEIIKEKDKSLKKETETIQSNTKKEEIGKIKEKLKRRKNIFLGNFKREKSFL